MLISLEGLPGAGKSTQAQLLTQHLRARGTLVTYLPDLLTLSVDPLGEDLFALFASTGDPFRRHRQITTDTYLAAAIRTQILASVIRPALDAGHVVIEDRGAHTMYSYSLAGILQHHRMETGAAIAWLKACGTLAGPEADLSIWLRLPPGHAARRVAARSAPWTDEQRAFLDYVHQAYGQLQRHDPRLVALDASGNPDQVHAAVADLIDTHPAMVRARRLPQRTPAGEAPPELSDGPRPAAYPGSVPAPRPEPSRAQES